MVVVHPKGEGVFVLVCSIMLLVKSRSTTKLDYMDCIIHYFSNSRGGGGRNSLDGFMHLKPLIQFWLGYLVEHLTKMNEEVIDRNRHQKETGNRRLVRKFSNNEFWKCIWCILYAVVFGKKVHKLWGGNSSRDSWNGDFLISRYVHRKTDLLRVICSLYHLHYSSFF